MENRWLHLKIPGNDVDNLVDRPKSQSRVEQTAVVLFAQFLSESMGRARSLDKRPGEQAVE